MLIRRHCCLAAPLFRQLHSAAAGCPSSLASSCARTPAPPLLLKPGWAGQAGCRHPGGRNRALGHGHSRVMGPLPIPVLGPLCRVAPDRDHIHLAPSSSCCEDVPSPNGNHFSLGRCPWSASSSLAPLLEQPRGQQWAPPPELTPVRSRLWSWARLGFGCREGCPWGD